MSGAVERVLYEHPAARAWATSRGGGARDFHRTLPGYRATRLVDVPSLADELGVARVFVKEESERLGLPAFKILGASYAIARALAERLHLAEPPRLAALRAHAAAEPVTLVAATDGNHGRAVAHTARLLDLDAHVLVPSSISEAAKAAIAAEGAAVVELAAPYDEVVSAAARAADELGEHGLLVQDTAWEGYERVPRWIVDGHATMFGEIDEQLAACGVARVSLLAVPVGVGSFAHAAVRFARSSPHAPSVLSVEPDAAPALLESLRAGRTVSVATGETIMAGLNCGTPSSTAWPDLAAGVDLALTVTDAEATRAVLDLDALGVDAAPCGAATLAGVRALAALRPLGADDVVVLLSTEGRGANPQLAEVPGDDPQQPDATRERRS